MSDSTKPVNQKAWFLILPVLLCVAFSAVLPLMTVVNYSVQDILSPTQKVFVGLEWFREVMQDPDLHGALLRQLMQKRPLVHIGSQQGNLKQLQVFQTDRLHQVQTKMRTHARTQHLGRPQARGAFDGHNLLEAKG